MEAMGMRGIFSIDSPLMSFLVKVFDCIGASILWLLFSLPIVTMGAAGAALYTTVYKYCLLYTSPSPRDP